MDDALSPLPISCHKCIHTQQWLIKRDLTVFTQCSVLVLQALPCFHLRGTPPALMWTQQFLHNKTVCITKYYKYFILFNHRQNWLKLLFPGFSKPDRGTWTWRHRETVWIEVEMEGSVWEGERHTPITQKEEWRFASALWQPLIRSRLCNLFLSVVKLEVRQPE